MPTVKQIEANRRNALKSTGPKTVAGKAAVRLNPLRHGLRARDVILPDEDPEEFHQLCDDLEAEWQPRTCTEQFYLEQMAVSHWKLKRADWGEADLFAEGLGLEKEFQILHHLWQTQNRIERSYARAQRELERLQNARLENAGLQADPQEELSAVAEPPKQVEKAGMCVAELSPAAHQPASPLPYPPIQIPDLVARLDPPQDAGSGHPSSETPPVGDAPA